MVTLGVPGVVGCQKPPGPVDENPAPAATTPSTPDVPIETPSVALPDPFEKDRWLFVERPKVGTRGGWATGSFDRERNKLAIRTRDVAGFAVELDHVPIDWDRLVIISIDGRNAELKRRDYTLLHFGRDQQGNWIVLEPGLQP
jgi:hypothetical protein